MQASKRASPSSPEAAGQPQLDMQASALSRASTEAGSQLLTRQLLTPTAGRLWLQQLRPAVSASVDLAR